MIKTCSTCKESKPISAFNKLKKAPDGLQYRCRDCNSTWYQNNRDAHRSNVQRKIREGRKLCECGNVAAKRYAKCTRCIYLSKLVDCPSCDGKMTPKASNCRECRITQGMGLGENNPNWSGGKVDQNGYQMIRVKDRGYVMEHRLVMELHLGRQLEAYENVHHKNGIKDDNRLENLELWITGQPTGQRVEDLLEWAMWITSRYGDQGKYYG